MIITSDQIGTAAYPSLAGDVLPVLMPYIEHHAFFHL